MFFKYIHYFNPLNEILIGKQLFLGDKLHKYLKYWQYNKPISGLKEFE